LKIFLNELKERLVFRAEVQSVLVGLGCFVLTIDSPGVREAAIVHADEPQLEFVVEAELLQRPRRIFLSGASFDDEFYLHLNSGSHVLISCFGMLIYSLSGYLLMEISGRTTLLSAALVFQAAFAYNGYDTTRQLRGYEPSPFGFFSEQPALVPGMLDTILAEDELEVHALGLSNAVTKTWIGLSAVSYALGAPGYELGRGLCYLLTSA